MRGVGGPLLCIGDLLSDVGESDAGGDQLPPRPTITPSPDYKSSLQPSDLNNLFQENYEQLNKALAGTDHSWTHLTLELCTALETANKLVHLTNSSVGMLKDSIEELLKVISRRDSAIEAAKAIEGSPKQPESTQRRCLMMTINFQVEGYVQTESARQDIIEFLPS